MKKTRRCIAALTAALVLLVCVCTSAVTAGAAKKNDAATGDYTVKYLNGDADGDGIVTIMDATVIQRLLAGITKDSSGMITVRGDVDKKGLAIVDATHIQRFLASFKDGYKINTEMEYIMTLPTQGENELPEIEV